MSTLLESLALLRSSLRDADPGVSTARVVAFLTERVGPTILVPVHGDEHGEVPGEFRRAMAEAGLEVETRRVGGRVPGVIHTGLPASAPDARAAFDVVIGQLTDAIACEEAKAEVDGLTKKLGETERLLAETTNALFNDAREAVRVLAELERRDEQVKAELHRALRFQHAMIGPLPTHESLTIEALYLAADVISADFYDVALLDSDLVRVFVADATGHGIAASLATLFLKAEYETRKRVTSAPADLVRELNDVMTTRYSALDLRFTALCLDFHPVSRRVRFTSAAHPGPVVLRAGGADFLEGDGTYVGLAPNATFSTHELELEAGDVVLAFSDGLVDVLGSRGGSARSILADAADAIRKTPAHASSILVALLAGSVGEGRALIDDVTAVALAVRPSAPGS
jgi:sigma-B regulation protein RsbU (phosphoserine phosphatase)